MIYFIQCGKNGPIKIGQTCNNPCERMAQLQTGCPYELNLLWVYTGNDISESEIHEDLKHERIRGEWFHPSSLVIQYMNELTNELRLFSPVKNHNLLIVEYLGGFKIEIGDFSMYLDKNTGIVLRPESPNAHLLPIKIDKRYVNVKIEDTHNYDFPEI